MKNLRAKEAKRIGSKRERLLKKGRPLSGNFEQMKKALIDSGVTRGRTYEGRVMLWNCKRKYGFISGDDGVKYFIHISDIVDGVPFLQGERVQFKIKSGTKAGDAHRIATGATQGDSKR